MDTYGDDILAVQHERLPYLDKAYEAVPFWTAVECLRADEHLCPPNTPVREYGVRHDLHVFSEETSTELWRNRTVVDPDDD